MSEVQLGTKLFSWQVGLEKSEQDQMVSGREKSQELVNQKIEKVLKCTKCLFTTSATLKKCKARKQIKQHEEKHKKEEEELLEKMSIFLK